jgi:hypothetical protein
MTCQLRNAIRRYQALEWYIGAGLAGVVAGSFWTSTSQIDEDDWYRRALTIAAARGCPTLCTGGGRNVR